jgi:hypothetical protein
VKICKFHAKSEAFATNKRRKGIDPDTKSAQARIPGGN